MKAVVVEPMLVYFSDGTSVVACCGPRALQLLNDGGVAYQPLGDKIPGVCCHNDTVRRQGLAAIEMEARDLDAVYEALGRMLG